MIIKSLEIADYRNYDSLHIDFGKGTNILYGDNAQGKTNILEAIYMSPLRNPTKEAKIRTSSISGKEEAHIRTYLEKEGIETRVDMHLRKEISPKGLRLTDRRSKGGTASWSF